MSSLTLSLDIGSLSAGHCGFADLKEGSDSVSKQIEFFNFSHFITIRLYFEVAISLYE